MDRFSISLLLIALCFANCSAQTKTEVTEPTHNDTTTNPTVPTSTVTPSNSSTSSTTVKPTSTSTTTSTTTTPASTTHAPSTSTHSPATTTSTTARPPQPSDRKFDAFSFIGGFSLAVGLVAIGFLVWKLYLSKRETVYHTL